MSSRGLTAGSSFKTSYFLDPAVKPRDDEVENEFIHDHFSYYYFSYFG
ncbi:MAG: palindromic element RPE4 domain-containing protein [Gammaproteobacteria bacterium]